MGPADLDSEVDDGWCLVEKPSAAPGSAAPSTEERWVVTPVENPCGRAKYVHVSTDAPRDAGGDEDDSVVCGSEDSAKSGGRARGSVRVARKPCAAKQKTKGRPRKKKLAPFCGRTLYP